MFVINGNINVLVPIRLHDKKKLQPWTPKIDPKDLDNCPGAPGINLKSYLKFPIS